MRIAFISLIFSSVVLSGCSWFSFPGVHKVPVQQGNIIDQEMIDKLRPGMTKSQVRFVLGTPLVVDTFNQSRWDYFFSRVDSRGEKTQEQLTVYFDEESKLQRISGDYLPSSALPKTSQAEE